MTFPADRRISTRFGDLDVVVEHHPTGVTARLARPEDWPRLSAVTGAIGQDEGEAVERLRAGIEQFGSGDATDQK